MRSQVLTSVVAVRRRPQDVWILQPASQGPHPPRAPEEGVPPGPQSTQLLHSSLFGSSVLEPNLRAEKDRRDGRDQLIGFTNGFRGLHQLHVSVPRLPRRPGVQESPEAGFSESGTNRTGTR